MKPSAFVSIGLAAVALHATPAVAQSSLDSLSLRFAALSAVTGMEDAMADSLLQLLPGSVRDRGGNVVLARGSGEPVRMAICPMDEVGWVVGEITTDGYLTLRRVGATNVGPLFDQFLEGQRVTVFGRRGPVPGVVGVRSTHLTRGRVAADEPPFPLDNAYLDVGAQSRAGAIALGIDILAPVTRAKAPERYGSSNRLLAAPWSAERAACAALASAALRTQAPASGSWIAVFAARRHFNNDGASFAVWDRAPDSGDVLLIGDAVAADPGAGIVATADSLQVGSGRRSVTRWSIPARYARTPVETVSLDDIRVLESQLATWLGAGR